MLWFSRAEHCTQCCDWLMDHQQNVRRLEVLESTGHTGSTGKNVPVTSQTAFREINLPDHQFAARGLPGIFFFARPSSFRQIKNNNSFISKRIHESIYTRSALWIRCRDPCQAAPPQARAVSLDNLFFVGHSVCANTDGTWRFKVEKEVRSHGAHLAMTSCCPPSSTLRRRAAPWWGAQGMVDR
jgi:hypothetical protein